MLRVELSNPDLMPPDLPDAVASHPGMISKPERALLYGLAKNAYRGQGRIVDGGMFLGASTSAFVLGLRADGGADLYKGPGKPVLSFEMAITGSNFARHAAKYGLASPAVGDSFEPILQELVAPYADTSEVVIGDILDYDLSQIGSIEIAFLDILKTPEVTEFCFRNMFPRLVPGAYVVQQDYFFHGQPDVKVAMEALADHFTYIGEVACSAVFQLSRQISDDLVTERLRKRSTAEALELHAAAEQRTNDPARQYLMLLSRAFLLQSRSDPAAARAVWQEADAKYPEVAFDKNRQYRNNISWRIASLKKAIERSEYRQARRDELS